MKLEPMKPAPPVTSRFTPASLEKTRQALAQALPPVRQSRRGVTFAPQHRIRRPGRRAGERLARHAPDAAGDAGLLEDRLRELRPGAFAVGGDVPDTFGKVDQGSRCIGEMGRVGPTD